jgi:hypothetical protein
MQRRYTLERGALLAADTIHRYNGGNAYRVTIVDETSIDVELLDPSIGFDPAERIVRGAGGDAGTPAGWLDDDLSPDAA